MNLYSRMLHETEEPLITNVDGFKLKGGLNYFIFWNKKSLTIKGDIMLKLTCATKCSILHIHPQLLREDNQHFTLSLGILPGAAVPHQERGTTIVCNYRTWATALPWLKWPLGLGVLIPFPFLPNISLLSPTHSAHLRTEECPSLSPPLVTLSSQAFSLDFPINPWEKKVPNSIREQILWFPNSKKHLIHALLLAD